ncbi:glutathione S-transferase [Rhodanobacter thiooxydans]|uniref:Glutathione S-transferase n=1 Tax=Rhodanobacter thiooxydans TaxID=416169 RepID=A0A154QFW9_9GAMM|nr:glutathione S-transferase family protein [Rhodanobacter thiooxydans]EIL98043.1 putative glutathione S-transferase [Rhodanobacter thiooxydans LCS2]KZC23108.1 glutathione S-transferase [Rhodanobacter thiooxydans]MCW0201139.1 glutathione S-transferase family protein [Rhodanobacter thiooxydans]
MPQRLRVIGNYLSPYVRKVLVCLELKGLEYEIDPIAPFVGNDEFTRLSPLRRIPVLIDGGLELNDSSVICQYLEDRQPTPSLYPRDIADRARARWLEEYADTRLADGLVWRLFNQLAIKRHVFGETPNEAVVQHAREVEIPAALNYLEQQLPEDGFVFGSLSIADISIASFFRTAAFVHYAIDAARWPLTAALVAQVQALPVFQKLAALEDCMLRLPLAEQRGALLAAGAPLTSDTLGTSTPRPGPPRAS